MLNRIPMLFTSVAIGFAVATAALVVVGSSSNAKSTAKATDTVPAARPLLVDNRAIVELHQTVYQSENPSPEQVKNALDELNTMLEGGKIQTGTDYLYASMIALKGSTVEAALLSHDFALCSLSLGDTRASEWIAAAQDQVMTRMNRPQRFGTGLKPGQTDDVDPLITDEMRRAIGVPSLTEAKNLASRGVTYGQSMQQRAAVAPARPMPAIAVAE